MKRAESIMEILEAYDLCRSYRGAAELAGCNEHTVAHYVARREAGESPFVARPRAGLADPYRAKVEEWVERSRGKVRADVCHSKLIALGYGGSERTTRRVVAAAKKAYRQGQRRVYRPWVPEPGMWFQWDWAQGPRAGERATSLFCAWLAWSRYRVVLPTWDRTHPTLVACLDRTLRLFGGVPTYGLTDNERTVTVDHVAGVAVRNPEIVAVARHYGFTVATCVPADPESKGGVEATVRLATADLVPAEANLRESYATFGALASACGEFADTVNRRPHRATQRPPIEMLAEERRRLHPVPAQPHTVAFGETRKVGWDGTISYGGVAYSVPSQLVAATVWCRVAGDELAIVALGDGAPREVARHRLSTPGQPRIDAAHYPPRPVGAPSRPVRPQSAEEVAFLAIGPGAATWLVAAGAQGAERVRRKMGEAVALAKLYGSAAVSQALGEAASVGRFGEGDLLRLVEHQRQRAAAPAVAATAGPPERWSLQPGTAAWEGFGR